MVGSRKIAWVAVVLIAASAALGSATMAADNAPKVAVLDVQKIYKDAPRIKQYMEELDVLRAQLGQKLEIRSQSLMLDENQIKELIDLKLKGVSATDKDKARMKELEDAERASDAEIKKLQGTQTPTDAEKARLKELQDMQQKSKTTGEALEKDYNSQLQTKAQELDEKARTDMQEAVNKVAEEKGYNLVLVKDAVMLGGVDISDAVIGKLDRKVQ